MLGAGPGAPPAVAADREAVDLQPFEYRIGPSDRLEISVWQNADISRTVTVRPDGKISLPLLNDIDAAGYTPTELRAILTRGLTEYVPSVEVSVIVEEAASFKVSVVGEVRQPGRYDFRTPATVLDAIASARGLSEFASKGGIFVLRSAGSEQRRIDFDYGQAVSRGGSKANFYLQPGDIVVVP